MMKNTARFASWIALMVVFGAIGTHGAMAKSTNHPLGTVTAFDGTTLEVTPADGSEPLSAPVADDVQVKISHRGNHSHGRGHGNPSNGTLEDVTVGALVLRMKLDEGEVAKLRIFPAPASDETSGDDTSGTDDETTGTDDDTTDQGDQLGDEVDQGDGQSTGDEGVVEGEDDGGDEPIEGDGSTPPPYAV